MTAMAELPSNRDAAGETPVPETAAPEALSPLALFLLAAVGAAVVANGYYIHPIVAPVAAEFGVGAAVIGLVPALNQMALALGIFLLLPLGDRFSNRTLVSVFAAGQLAALVLMLASQEFVLFAAGSTLLGFVTITPYILPAYVSKRVPPETLGRATAILTTGIIAGILLARVMAGAVAAFAGWRWVYGVAVAVMLAVTLALPLMMQERRPGPPAARRGSYGALLTSIVTIVRGHPGILVAGTIQGLNFGIFLATWMGLGLHLTSEAMGHGTDAVGYLAALAIVNLAVTPRLGSWADATGAHRARARLALVQFAGAALFMVTGHSLWWLILPILLTNVTGPGIDVCGRMTFLSLQAEVRTRLMTVYIVFMFAIGGLASWAGAAAYELAGWRGTALFALALSIGVVSLSVLSARRHANPAAAPLS